MNFLAVVILVAGVVAVKSHAIGRILVGPEEHGVILKGPATKTLLHGPDGSTIEAVADSGSVIADGHLGGVVSSHAVPGVVTHPAEVVAHALPAVIAAPVVAQALPTVIATPIVNKVVSYSNAVVDYSAPVVTHVAPALYAAPLLGHGAVLAGPSGYVSTEHGHGLLHGDW